MKQTVEYTSWPLPEDLTQKVVNYLDVYRLIIALILSAAHFGTLERMPGLLTLPFFAGVTLVLFVLAALFYLYASRRVTTDFFRLASLSLSTDVLFLGALVVTTSGIEDGLGILLVFTSGVAAVLLPLRYALLLASVAAAATKSTAARKSAASSSSEAQPQRWSRPIPYVPSMESG